jgi:broad specificity phosphatase PhoE
VTITELILVRHGESEGNVAREAAEAEQADEILIDQRDPDVPLSARGRSQAEAVGRWLAEVTAERQPSVAWSSPYTRARQTAELALGESGIQLPLHVDERLRDRELGILDRLTSRGVTARYPSEADRRRYLGKMYYRPPGGESWADMALRLRSFLADLDRAHEAGCGLVVCHDAVILVLRYILEELTEKEVLDVAATQSLGNGSVTRLVRPERRGSWQTLEFNVQEHLTDYGSEPTSHEAEQDVHPR